MDVLYKKCQSLRQTSTGIGHIYREPLPSDFNIESQRGDPLPPLLRQPYRLPPAWHFSSTVRLAHGRKPLAGPLTHPRYSKAVPHWTSNFVNEYADGLRHCQTLRMISPPSSETQDRYRAWSAPQRREAQHYTPLLALSRQFETDKVPALNVPSVSTTHADYRRYGRSELVSPGGFDCDGEARGRMPPPPEAPPTASSQPFLHCPPRFVPHGGRTTAYRDGYARPGRRSPDAAPVREAPDWPAAQAGGDLYGHVLQVPKMYSTENQNYGGRTAALV